MSAVHTASGRQEVRIETFMAIAYGEVRFTFYRWEDGTATFGWHLVNMNGQEVRDENGYVVDDVIADGGCDNACSDLFDAENKAMAKAEAALTDWALEAQYAGV